MYKKTMNTSSLKFLKITVHFLFNLIKIMATVLITGNYIIHLSRYPSRRKPGTGTVDLYNSQRIFFALYVVRSLFNLGMCS